MEKHYIRLDSKNNITHGFSTAFEAPQSGDIKISDAGDRHFMMDGIANPSLVTTDGIYAYSYVSDVIHKKTDTEIEAERKLLPPKPPSIQEQLDAQAQAIMALMGGV